MKELLLKKRILISFCYLLLFIGSDQWTKIWASETLKGHHPQSYFGGLLKLLYAENTGAWGNLGSNWPPFFRDFFLLYLPLALMIGLFLFSFVRKNISSYDFHAYSLILAGGIGNLIDRFSNGYVVDFLWVGIESVIGTNIFNIADMVIMAGFIMLLLEGLKEWYEKRGEAKAPPEK
jgi:signal peptidase II